MSESDAPNSSLTGKLPLAAVLGLAKVDEGELAQLRGLQYSALAGQSRYRLLANVVMALVTVWLFLPSIAPLWLGLWFALVTTVQIRGVNFDRSLADGQRRNVSRDEVLRQSFTPTCSGVLWAVPLTYFGFIAGEVAHASAWAVVAALLTGSALLFRSAPLGTLIFATIVGVAALCGFSLTGQYELAGVVTIFTGLVIYGSIEVAHTGLIARIAENGVAEKDQVVSLLLREFEENEADWLWEVDTSRRVRAVSPRFAFALGQMQSDAEARPLLGAGRREILGKRQFPNQLA